MKEFFEFKTANGIKRILVELPDKFIGLNEDEILYAPEELEIIEKQIKAYLANERKEKGLLTGEAIKSIREKTGLSGQKLEELLGLGAKSFARWENYKADQSIAIDFLLRAINKQGLGFIEEINQEKSVA